MAGRASFHWDDPLLLEQQLSDEERQVRDAAHAYSHLSDDTKSRPDTTQICGACMSFAPLASAVGGPTTTLQIEHCGSKAAVPAATAESSTAVPLALPKTT